MNLNDLHIPYIIPTVLLIFALGLKFPTFIRAWRDPDVRATSLLLLLASAVFLSVAPVSIHEINSVTGMPNFGATWTYSLLTAFCGSCLTMIITWREEPSVRRRRRIRRVWLIYTGIIIALWVAFALADATDERIYDFDTYFANTPWLRELILLYLSAHMVSAVAAAYMIWRWIPKVRAAWLKAGLVFLQAGYAFGLVFDVAKVIAISARWANTDWDFLSTDVAPPFAILDATLVAIGFIIPQAGPFLQQWRRDQSAYWVLRPLWRAVRTSVPSSAKARVGRLAPLDLRLLQRQQHIHDGLLRLAPHFNSQLLHRAYEEARAAGHREDRAHGIAGAVAVRAALEASRGQASQNNRVEPARLTGDFDDIESIARALYHVRLIDMIRQRVSPTESLNTHA
ncbi:MAB_1171c family putative transporter [Streptomyces sp. NPDC005474]|uniref:MAB_1171c family putative transporter n=1 Tax=Streptomyces sp. NPDC005474 TaxID=3154878 RepID=UPI0034525140